MVSYFRLFEFTFFFFFKYFFITGILDLVLNFPGYHRWKFTDVLRNVLKILVSLAWAIILPLSYTDSSWIKLPWNNIGHYLHELNGIPPLYIAAVLLYLLPNVLAGLLFLFPMLRRWIENSDWGVVRMLLWWSQVCRHMFFHFFFIIIFIVLN